MSYFEAPQKKFSRKWDNFSSSLQYNIHHMGVSEVGQLYFLCFYQQYLQSQLLMYSINYVDQLVISLLQLNYIMNQNQADLVKHLVYEGVIKSKQVAQVMQKVDRKYYAPRFPYMDSPQPLGYGATISAPHMHAYALQFLEKHLLKARKVLDVGSGTGYLTAAMSLLAPKQCTVYGIQHVPELVQLSLKNIQNDHPELLKQKRVIIKQGDGRMGWQDQNLQFDAIHVGAASEKVPQKLIEQLAQGGRMVIPVGGDFYQDFMAFDKVNGEIKKTVLTAVRYVPLTDLKKQIHEL